MDDDSQRFLNDQLQKFRQYLDAEVCRVENHLGQQLRSFAQVKIAEVRASMEVGIQKAQTQFEKEMTTADKYAYFPELANSARKSAKRQLESSIQGYKDIADQAVRSIQALVK